jgi:hypothetical protein
MIIPNTSEIAKNKKEYLENHPFMNEEPDQWKNIPICIVNAFQRIF